MSAVIDACAACLRRTDLIAALSGRIEFEWRLRRGRPQLLALSDRALLEWAADADAAQRYQTFVADLAVDRLIAGGIGAVCGHAAGFPAGLRELPDPPAVLHLLGDPAVLAESSSVALVGARRPSAYGLEIARSLARGLAASGVPVVSGMAMGIDSAAHAGALEGGGRTVAVLATGVDRPYPARARTLHGRIAEAGCVVSELPPGSEPRRWAFPARNRLIAALAAGTVVVEGGERSGSLISADFAAELGRFVGAVPGAVTARMAAGPHLLLKSGAELVRGIEDILDLLHGAGAGARIPVEAAVIGSGDRPPPRPCAAAAPVPADLDARLVRLLAEIERGNGSLSELVTDPANAFEVSRGLGELELRGLVTRVFGGRYIRAAR
jgi:DNA processing protein